MSPGLILAVCLLQTPQPPAAPAGAAPTLAPAGAAPTLSAPAAPTADQLIARVRDRYAHCRTYRDDARGRRKYRDDSAFGDDAGYRLALERPDRFRFEKGEYSRWQYRGEETIWRERAEWRHWERRESRPSVVTPEVGHELFGMFDVFSEWIIPLLDVPEMRGQFQRETWGSARPTGDVVREAVGGVDRWRIELEVKDGHARVWIGDDGAVWRVEVDATKGSREHDQLDLSPEFDVALDPGELALSPPHVIGVKPSVVMHALMILGFIVMGTIGVLLGLRLQRTGRPFTVSPNLIGWFAASVGGAELLARFVDQLDLSRGWSGSALILGPVIAAGAWPVVKHLRRQFGFHVVGVDKATFVDALRAVVAGLGLPAMLSAATPKVTIDGRSFDVASRPTWSMFGLLTKEKGSRELLDRLRPLVAACFETEELPTNRHAGLRIIAWSAAMIVGAIVLGGFLFTVFDFV